MNDQDFQAYLDGRYTQMLSFYDQKAISNKRGYRVCSVYILVSSLLLAPLVAIDLGAWRPVLALLSTSIAASAAVLSHFKFHENWLRYRSTWDRLTREPSLRMAGLAYYAQQADPNALFVERVEAIMKLEGEQWHSEHAKAEDLARRMKGRIDTDDQSGPNEK